MADRWVVLDAHSLGVPVYDNEDDANNAAWDSATPKVVVPVTVPDDAQHVVYDDIHNWAIATDDPQSKGKKYVDRYHGPGRDFEDHRSIPREVVDAYNNVRGSEAENGSENAAKAKGTRAVKVNRDA